VSDVLKDLKEQYNKIVDPTPVQKQQYHAEVQRVQEIAKSDPNDVYTEIGDQLGVLMDSYDALSKALLAEQVAGSKVYKGDESIGRRALRRIIITTRLDAMLVKLRRSCVLATAVSGAVGTVMVAPEYTPVPFTTRKSQMLPTA